MLQPAISKARTPLAQLKIVYNHAQDMSCRLTTVGYSFTEWQSSDMKEESSRPVETGEQAATSVVSK